MRKTYVISVNHTMNYTIALNGKCEYIITTPKTKNANREIPMLKDVRETLEEMFARRDDFNGSNQIVIDGYTGFIFRDLYGSVYNNRRINEALKRLTKDRNEEEIAKAKEEGRTPFLLPHFTCHNLRHTFCSRLITNGCNIKTVQVLMGHAHAETTMRIYANVTQSQNQEEMAVLEGKMRLR